MQPAPIPPDEHSRLAHLRALLVLDTPPEPVFDSIARLASELCGVPVALLSLVDAERQWFKAHVGLPGVNETPRDVAFCAHAIGQDQVFEVPDALQDPRFADNPFVSGAPDIRFYAGAPLVLSSGSRIGTLCVIDRQSRQLRPDQRLQLQALAQVAVQALEMRRSLIDRALSVRSAHEQRLAESETRHRAMLDTQSELVSQSRADGTLVYVNPAYARHFGLTVAAILGTSLYDYVDPADRAVVRERVDWVLTAGETLRGENRMHGAAGDDRWVAWTNSRQTDADGQPLLHSVGRDISARKRAEQALRSSQAFLARTGRVAGVGGWELDLASGRVTWSDETRRIHEVDPAFQPTLDNAIAFYADAARAQITTAVQLAVSDGTAWDLELPFVTARGRHIWVRAVGEAEFEAGRAVRLVGAFQDISERRQLQQRLADNEAFLRDLADSLPVRIAHLDTERRYRFVNRLHCERFQRPREQIIGRTRSELLGAASEAMVESHIDQVLAGRPQAFEFSERVDGRLRWLESRLVPDLDAEGRVRGFFSTSFDITDRAEAARESLRQQAILNTVTEAIPAVVSVVDRALRYQFVNAAFERWNGLTRAQVLGRVAADVMPAHDVARSQGWAERALAGETVHFERAYPDRDGAPHLAVTYVPVRLADGTVEGFVGIAQDITRQHQEQRRLRDLAQRDPLTGLLNRAGFEAELAARIEAGEGPSLALLYLDLDHFKPVNDQHGHPVGDRVLQVVAQRLQAAVRPTDAVARLGGDEFALLLVGVRAAANADAVAQKIVDAVGKPILVAALALHVSASVGVAVGINPVGGAADLVARADTMLYRAKQAGRGRSASAAAR
ncbi:MAG: PAS domain S-box protein [Rubrivivax sp.]|nr:PAS domain S-box protein [Rubrivivax sp.]